LNKIIAGIKLPMELNYHCNKIYNRIIGFDQSPFIQIETQRFIIQQCKDLSSKTLGFINQNVDMYHSKMQR
jgi:hypothetical protein